MNFPRRSPRRSARFFRVAGDFRADGCLRQLSDLQCNFIKLQLKHCPDLHWSGGQQFTRLQEVSLRGLKYYITHTIAVQKSNNSTVNIDRALHLNSTFFPNPTWLSLLFLPFFHARKNRSHHIKCQGIKEEYVGALRCIVERPRSERFVCKIKRKWRQNKIAFNEGKILPFISNYQFGASSTYICAAANAFFMFLALHTILFNKSLGNMWESIKQSIFIKSIWINSRNLLAFLCYQQSALLMIDKHFRSG